MDVARAFDPSPRRMIFPKTGSRFSESCARRRVAALQSRAEYVRPIAAARPSSPPCWQTIAALADRKRADTVIEALRSCVAIACDRCCAASARLCG